MAVYDQRDDERQSYWDNLAATLRAKAIAEGNAKKAAPDYAEKKAEASKRASAMWHKVKEKQNGGK